MKYKFNNNDIRKSFAILLGTFIYALGMNIFIVPAGLYAGGLLGLAQIIRTILEEFVGLSIAFDISGIISFLLNIPLMIITYKTVGKGFIIKTVACIAMQTIFLSLIPVQSVINDSLTACIIGGIMCGFGVGMQLQNGGSSGGVDIIGMFLAKKSTYSVGAISLMINVIVYIGAFLIMKDIVKIIYTLIFAAINMFALDRIHTRNINSEVLIISRHNNNDIQKAIMNEMRRGVSYWNGYGAFTEEDRRILFVIVSKYEITQLKNIVYSIDKNAFVSVKNGISISGNFEKRL